MMSLRFDFLSFLSVICYDDFVLRNAYFSRMTEIPPHLISSQCKCFIGLIHFYVLIYKPWPDIHSVRIGLTKVTSGPQCLVYKIGIGL